MKRPWEQVRFLKKCGRPVWREKSVLSADRVSGMDYWVSYLALYFDINFPETWQIIRENHYIDRIAARVPYSREDTKEKVAHLMAALHQRMKG